ncbi:MAG: ribosome biogenesis GTPase YlqF [Candidatus Izemoplasmatales bacterium]|jgi:ribosome biogenesis GTPase A|nr:ribosome biogenesis GTPase YlqF [bacterium]MDZ4196407.1 ribosome biogenesis GTPase YlqF [Candidatus Izemoplasmatales bacterium]
MKQIQWFPGHMAKARRQVEEKLGVIDVVFELLDARAVKSSMNPTLSEIIKNKPKMVLLNKADLADPKQNKRWVNYFENQGIAAVCTNSLVDDLSSTLVPRLERLMAPLREKEESRGMKKRPLRVMIVGIPNVGKSQFINRLSNKNKTKTGDKPGVTKIQQYLRVGDDFEVLDNPGILWPKFDDPDVGFKLALLGSIKDDLLPLDEVLFYGLRYLKEYYPNQLKERYSLTSLDGEIVDLLEQIGRNRGSLLKGNTVDMERVIKYVVADIREAKFGRVSYDRI